MLRERLEHELGRDGFAARAGALAARLVAAGLWHDALGVLARASTPTVFGETLARALRAVPALDAEHALRWIEHVEDEHAIADGDLALTRARAARIPRRSGPGPGRPPTRASAARWWRATRPPAPAVDGDRTALDRPDERLVRRRAAAAPAAPRGGPPS